MRVLVVEDEGTLTAIYGVAHGDLRPALTTRETSVLEEAFRRRLLLRHLQQAERSSENFRDKLLAWGFSVHAELERSTRRSSHSGAPHPLYGPRSLASRSDRNHDGQLGSPSRKLHLVRYYGFYADRSRAARRLGRDEGRRLPHRSARRRQDPASPPPPPHPRSRPPSLPHLPRREGGAPPCRAPRRWHRRRADVLGRQHKKNLSEALGLLVEEATDGPEGRVPRGGQHRKLQPLGRSPRPLTDNRVSPAGAGPAPAPLTPDFLLDFLAGADIP